VGPKELVRRVQAYMDLLGLERPSPENTTAFDRLEDPDEPAQALSS
jgi:hypothetical protein